MDINGKQVAETIKQEIIETIQKTGCRPAIAFILVGEDPPSQTYVRMKTKMCQAVGIESIRIELPENVSIQELLKEIEALNQNPLVHGILVQMPLPRHLDEKKVLASVDVTKDVDGFHPMNVGRMLMQDPDAFIPCTPFGILKLLEAYEVPMEGAQVTIVGRSNIVGRPLANLLSQKASYGNATVTLAHSYTKKLAEVCQSADILIAAMGRPKTITKSMVKKGAVVIDVGINRTDMGIVGDVDYKEVSEVASLITPVPGGVGPMTIAMLLYNTLKSALRHQSIAI